MFAHKSFLIMARSPRVRLHTSPYEPLMAIQSMVTRKDFDGRV